MTSVIRQKKRFAVLCMCLVLFAVACADGGDDGGRGNAADDDGHDDDAADGQLDGVEPAEIENFLPVELTITAESWPGTITAVRLGDVALTSVVRVSDTELTAVTPSGLEAGVFDVHVEVADEVFTKTDALTVVDALTPFVRVSGVVRDPEGEPIENLMVHANSEIYGELTNDAGWFELFNRPGLGQMWAYNPDWDGAAGVPWGQATLLDGYDFGDDESFDFTLEYFWLRGTVTDERGDVLPSVGIQVFPAEDIVVLGETVTDFFGEFEVPVYAGQYSVLADPSTVHEIAPGYEPLVEMVADNDLPMTLVDGVELSGTITDRDGEGLVNLCVLPTKVEDKQIGMASDYTDEEGRYLAFLETGQYYIDLADPYNGAPWLPEFGTFAADLIELEADTEFNYQFEYLDVDIDLTFDGEPFGGQVCVDLISQTDWRFNAMLRYPEQAQARVFAGTYTVRLQPGNGYGAAATVYPAVELVDDQILSLALDTAVVLSGTVGDQHGEPLSGFEVCATGPMDQDDLATQYAFVADDGSYALDLKPGRYSIEARRVGGPDGDGVTGLFYQAPDVEVTADQTFAIVIDMATVDGVVRHGGEPAPHWRVNLWSPAFFVGSVTADENGEFSVDLPTDEFTFTFSAADPRSARPYFTTLQRVERDAHVVVNVPLD